MNTILPKSKTSFLFLFFFACALLPKIGFSEHSLSAQQTKSHFSDTEFSLEGNTVRFESDNVNTAAIEYNFRLNPFMSFGAGFSYGEWDVVFDSGGYTGSANIYNMYAQTQIFFIRGKPVRPYIGFSLGEKTLSLHSATDVRLKGYSRIFQAGLEVRPVRKIGFVFSYNRSYDSLDDVNGNELRANYESITANVKIYFMRPHHHKSRSKRDVWDTVD